MLSTLFYTSIDKWDILIVGVSQLGEHLHIVADEVLYSPVLQDVEYQRVSLQLWTTAFIPNGRFDSLAIQIFYMVFRQG